MAGSEWRRARHALALEEAGNCSGARAIVRLAELWNLSLNKARQLLQLLMSAIAIELRRRLHKPLADEFAAKLGGGRSIGLRRVGRFILVVRIDEIVPFGVAEHGRFHAGRDSAGASPS